MFNWNILLLASLGVVLSQAIDVKAEFSNEADESNKGWSLTHWPKEDIKIGQASGVTVDEHDNVYVFHRSDHVWDSQAFSMNNIYQLKEKGPISEPTILKFDKNGQIVSKWGSGMFYMPHGIAVDKNQDIWLTDVALHQVMKYSPKLNSTSLVLGEAFIPGSDSRHFCKPTSIAITANGDFFVADGYCNSRILKFNAQGVKILEWGRSTIRPGFRTPGKGEFFIPHGLTLAEDKGLICVADRGNGRVQCFNLNTGNFSMQISSHKMGKIIFSVTYSSKNRGIFFIINGMDYPQKNPIKCFVVTPNGEIQNSFGLGLKTPHDIAVSSDAESVYVVEIDPYVVRKFVSGRGVSTTMEPAYQSEVMHFTKESKDKGLIGALLVTGACLIFSVAIITSAFIYSRARKSDCRRCGWHPHESHDGFNLGNIINSNANHQGFVKLRTGEESDEDQSLA